MITTDSEMFHAFEERYRDQIPSVSGDFTPYWEDGAASSARETSINRAAAERLVQAQTLWAMRGVQNYPAGKFNAAWREALLYDEHTWGAHNSITEPESDFALNQWRIKQAFALEAERQSRDLLAEALDAQEPSGQSTRLTCTTRHHGRAPTWWKCPVEWTVAGDRVTDEGGNPVPSQRLASGALVFLAKDVPPLGAARFRFQSGEPFIAGRAEANGPSLSNGAVTLTVDETTGAIASLACEGSPVNLVDGANGLGLNDYFYVAGRDPKTAQRNGPAKIAVKESGPLVAALEVTSDAPGCRGLTRELRVVAGLDHVDLSTTLDKENIYDPEASAPRVRLQCSGWRAPDEYPLGRDSSRVRSIAGVLQELLHGPALGGYRQSGSRRDVGDGRCAVDRDRRHHNRRPNRRLDRSYCPIANVLLVRDEQLLGDKLQGGPGRADNV